MSIKPIQSPSVPIKPREDSDPNHVGTLTLECTVWNWTTDKLITQIFEVFESFIVNY